MKISHTVRIMGRELSVRSAASPERVRAVEAFINGRLQDISAVLKNGDPQLILMLGLLNTAEELLQLRESREGNGRLDERLRLLLDKLEQA